MINRIEALRLKLLKEGRKIINLSSGNTNEHGINFPTSILKKSLQGFWENSAYAPHPKGDLKARKAVALFYKKRGYSVDPEDIVLTSGTSESYFHIFKWLTFKKNARPKVLLPLPGYPLFEEIARLADIEVMYYTLQENNGWQIDTEHVEKQILQTKPDAIVLVSPHNPTGSVLSSQTLENVILMSQKYNLSIISDEVFSEYMFDGKKFPRIAQMTNNCTIFTLHGISKTYCLPGLKLSWVVMGGPHKNEIIDELERSIDVFLSTNVIAQSMLPILMKEGERACIKTKKIIEQNRNEAISILGRVNNIFFHNPEGGFYVFIKVNGLTMTDEKFVLQLMEQTGIFVHPGYFYDYDNGLYIVISLAFEPKLFKKTLKKLAKFIVDKQV